MSVATSEANQRVRLRQLLGAREMNEPRTWANA